MASISSLWATIEASRKLLTMLAVLAVASGLYAWGATARRDADTLAKWGDLVCAEAASQFRVATDRKSKWGVQCRTDIQRLAKIEDDLKTGSLDALLADLERRDGKTATDAALAAALAKRAADAAERMEQADAAVEGDRVDGSWACAVNELGGMRAPGC